MSINNPGDVDAHDVYYARLAVETDEEALIRLRRDLYEMQHPKIHPVANVRYYWTHLPTEELDLMIWGTKQKIKYIENRMADDYLLAAMV